MKKMIIGINEKPKPLHWVLLSLQHVFAMFGATILVPILTGLSIGVALVASGVGTLIYIICTKGKVPMYLGSSFAYIGAISAAVLAGTPSAAFTGLIVVGLIYVVVGLIIKATGTNWIKKALPPVVVGPMIIIIGLGLASVAIESAGFMGGAGLVVPVVAIVTLLTTILVSTFSKGFFKIIPFLVAIFVGYSLSMILGLVPVAYFLTYIPYPNVFMTYAFFQVPEFTIMSVLSLDFSFLLVFAPLALVTIAEHIGDHSVLGEICEEDFLKSPGLHRTIIGDGLATMFAGLIGGPANTSYGENTGVVAMTKVGSVWVIILAAIFAIMLGFLGFVQAFVASIPWAVIGGLSIVLYGAIASNGIKVLIAGKVDLSKTRNLIIVSVMLVVGLGGAVFTVRSLTLMGMSLAAIIGVVLNLALPEERN